MAFSPEPEAAPRPHLHIEAIQTVTPMKATEPGKSRQVTSASPLTSAALAAHLRVMLYYRRAREEDSGWALAGWLKESLNAALLEQPLLAGRLRRSDNGEGLEVRFNDAGVRLVQAQADATMAEFLGGEGREAKEAHLAYWEDVDEQNPQFSALFYVQVTSFQDDGYSVGISCSPLLADPLCASGFLQTWAQTHTKMQAQDHFSKLSIFHLGNFKRRGGATYLKSTPMDPILGCTHRTVLFDHPAVGADEHVLAACIKEAAQRAEEKVKEASALSVIVAGVDRSKELKVAKSSVKELTMSSGSSMRAPEVVDWARLHVDELAFGEGNKPVQVSYHVVAGEDQPLVMVMPPLAEGRQGLISVTLPKTV